MADTYYIPDTSGANPNYAAPTQIVTFFKSPQVLKFTVPVFFDTITIAQTNNGPAWVSGTDFVVNETDDTAMSQAMNIVPTFTRVLVKSITLKKALPAAQVYQLSVNYQSFYPTSGVIPFDTANNVFEFTPDLLSDLYRRTLAFQQRATGVSSTTILPSGMPKILAWDKDETNPDNLITAEPASANTFQGQSVIRPLNAPFFKDSVVVTMDGTTLTMDKDYTVRGFSPSRTEMSANDSGVYYFIVLNTPYAGTGLAITYHAVGGEVQAADLQEFQAALMDVVTFLSNSDFLTQEQIPDTGPFLDINSRVTTLESEVKALMSGSPSYGSTTSGTTVTRSLLTTDTKLHWWNIATLYMVPGSTDVVSQDAIDLRIQMPTRQLQADLTISVNSGSANTPIELTVHNVNYDQGYLVESMTVPTSLPAPVMFRAIWCDTTTTASGIILQIGTAVPSLSESLGVEDRSTIQSAWQLTTVSGTSPVSPDDNGPITMPNSARTWTYGTTGNNAAVAVLTAPQGALLYAGSQTLDAIYSGTGQSVTLTNPNWSYLDYSKLKKIKVFMLNTVASGASSVVEPYWAEAPAAQSTTNEGGVKAVISGLWNGVSANGVLVVDVKPSAGGVVLTYNLPNTDNPNNSKISYIVGYF